MRVSSETCRAVCRNIIKLYIQSQLVGRLLTFLVGNCDYTTCEFDESDVVEQEDFYPEVPRYWLVIHIFVLQV